MKVYIDPGHGGSDPGAVGMYGTKESFINLRIAHELNDELRFMGYATGMTRHGDRYVDLKQRAVMANSDGADVFISIHCNASINRQAHGFEIYTTPGETRADALATGIYDAWYEAFPESKLRPDWSDGDPDKEANYSVLRNTKMPAVLVECDFISNPSKEEWLNDVGKQKLMAKAIAQGIEKWTKKSTL